MAFCNKEKQLVSDGYTVIDNKFFLNYLPDAPDKCVAVYLLGLALSNSEGSDNSIETIAQKLGITTDDVMTAYQYWDELDLPPVKGLVQRLTQNKSIQIQKLFQTAARPICRRQTD